MGPKGNSSLNVHLSLGDVFDKEKTEIKSAGPRSTKIIVRSKNRSQSSENVNKKFKQKGIRTETISTNDSSFPATFIKLDDKTTLTIIYKPMSDEKVSTALAESAQAVYASMAMDILKRDIKNSDLVDKNFKNSMKSSFTTEGIEKIMSKLNDEWIDSSMKGANALRQKYRNSSFEFHRGSRKVKTIEESFSKIKKNEGLSIDINKWSPADIYLIKKGFDPSVLKEENTIRGLNALMYKLLIEEKLIGVSLKKISGTPSISNINFPKDKDISEFEYGRMTSPPESTSGYIEMKKGSKNMKINFRNFTASGGFSGEVIVPGASARHGKISHGPINDVLKQHGLKQIPSNPESRAIAVKNSKQDAEYIAQQMSSLGFIQQSQIKGTVSMIMAKDVNYRHSKYLTMKLFEILKKLNSEEMTNITEDFYRYAGSQIKGVSGPYIKLQ